MIVGSIIVSSERVYEVNGVSLPSVKQRAIDYLVRYYGLDSGASDAAFFHVPIELKQQGELYLLESDSVCALLEVNACL